MATADLMSALDPEVHTVATALSKDRERTTFLLEGGPASVCQRAWAECRAKLEAALASFNVYVGSMGMQSQYAAVLNSSYYGSGTRARLRMNQIVVDDTFYANSLSVLQQWVIYTALKLLFQAAALHLSSGKDGKNSDRYSQKEERYRAEQGRLWQQLVAAGLPYVYAPLDCPGSLHGWSAGTWDSNALSTVSDQASINANDQNIRLAITYYDTNVYTSPLAKNNAESGPSQVIDFTIPAGQLVTVDISSLNPPDKTRPPQVGLSQGVVSYLSATHWLIYAGIDQEGSALYQQSAGIPVATTQYTLPATLVTSGPTLMQGQVPDPNSNAIFSGVIARG